MSDCPSLVKCPFYNDKIADKPILAEMYKKKYCKSNNNNCARWKIATTLGKQFVPTDLFPNQVDRINEIIQKNK